MLVIRLARGGRKKYPLYRIVAADQRRAATGKFVAILGNYNPHTKELVIKKEELGEFIKNGAQPSDAVLRLMKKDGIELPTWATITTKNRKPKKEVEAKPETPAETPETTPESEVAAEPAEEKQEAEVASAAADAKEEIVMAEKNIDDAETDAPTDAAVAEVEATADAAIETAQAEDAAPAAEEAPAEA